MKLLPLLFLTTSLFAAEPVTTVTSTPGLVAFWDFVKREADGDAEVNVASGLAESLTNQCS